MFTCPPPIFSYLPSVQFLSLFVEKFCQTRAVPAELSLVVWWGTCKDKLVEYLTFPCNSFPQYFLFPTSDNPYILTFYCFPLSSVDHPTFYLPPPNFSNSYYSFLSHSSLQWGTPSSSHPSFLFTTILWWLEWWICGWECWLAQGYPVSFHSRVKIWTWIFQSWTNHYNTLAVMGWLLLKSRKQGGPRWVR